MIEEIANKIAELEIEAKTANKTRVDEIEEEMTRLLEPVLRNPKGLEIFCQINNIVEKRLQFYELGNSENCPK